jgi:hypothetical protein
MDFSKARGRLEWWKGSGASLLYGAGERGTGTRSGRDELVIRREYRISERIP